MPETTPIHPGVYVKCHVIPIKLTVTHAAKLIGVGRPALSNFLNGKANLSLDMATRLSKAFGVDKEELLSIQHQYISAQQEHKEKQIAVKTYTSSLLSITASHIDAWAEKLDTRPLLPALLRRLILSTGSDVASIDFPAYDNSQRPGWDGHVESQNTTAWVPNGISGWEFGCNNDPQSKANNDYNTRTKNTPKRERENTTFIFVTPRDWLQKGEWQKKKKAENKWKDVKTYDANDLEQWLEVSVAGQVWMAGNLGIENDGAQTTHDYWNFWSKTATPPISKKIFDSAITDSKDTFTKWLNSDSGNLLKITARSKEEAIAFTCCALDQIDEMTEVAQKSVIVSKAITVNRLAFISSDFIPIVHTDDAQHALVSLVDHRSAILIVERGIKTIECDITVDIPSYEAFRNALTEMGFDDAEIDVHATKSKKSPTILRRQLTQFPGLSKPIWANDNYLIEIMIPLVFAGVWNEKKTGDVEILSCLAQMDFTKIQQRITEICNIDDAPLWHEGNVGGVVSKLECLHLVSDYITKNHVNDFFDIAEFVLSESDPALELEKEKRWMANIYDKVRDHSGPIRESISDNLIMLSIYGNSLFGNRLGLDIEYAVSKLIRKLLHSKDEEAWLSQNENLTQYAEAAPDEFLDILDYELNKAEPAISALFESVDSGAFSRCERTQMLWALELLAWNPSYLSRVCSILAKLCSYQLEDNWVNKPFNSLKDIFLDWLPHTTATLDQRIDALEMLCRNHPRVGWKICMSFLEPGLGGYTSGTNKPSWRDYASGSRTPITNKERFEFLIKCKNIAMNWPTVSIDTLFDLVTCLSKLEENDQKTVENLTENWLLTSPPPEEIDKLREHVRTSTMTRRARIRKPGNDESYANGKRIYDILEPSDPIRKHLWLFEKHWIEFSPEELIAEEYNHEIREQWIKDQRISALKIILEQQGFNGILDICRKGEAGYAIGYHLSSHILDYETVSNFILKSLPMSVEESSASIKNCISGALCQFTDEQREIFFESLKDKYSDALFPKYFSLFFHCCPFSRMTWNLLGKQSNEIQKFYWRDTNNDSWDRKTEEDLNYAIDKLIGVDRPHKAFHLGHCYLKKVTTDRIVKLLNLITEAPSVEENIPRIDAYSIGEALETIAERDDVNNDDLIQLEYIYAEAITSNSSYGIPALSKAICDSPLMFVQLVGFCYKRDDNGEDPQDWQVPSDPEKRQIAARRAHKIIDCINMIPGTVNDDNIDIDHLQNWIESVRKLAKENGRAAITDQKIGELLSKSKVDDDGVWPRKEVREVFEYFSSIDIATGMGLGLYNSRGVISRPQYGGGPEWELAKKYRGYSEKMASKMPFVSRMLTSIADSYERDAEWHDTSGRAEKWLRS